MARTADLSASSHRDTLDTLVSAVKAGKIQIPVMSRQERKDLDINTTGAYALWDFIKRDPYHLGYTATSQLIMLEAANRVRDDDRLERLAFASEEFNEKSKPLKLALRKTLNDIIDGLKGSFRWFVPREDLHAWFFDEESQLIALDRTSKAQMPKTIILAYAIEVVLETDQLSDTMRADLNDELFAAKLFMGRMASEFGIIIKDLREREKKVG